MKQTNEQAETTSHPYYDAPDTVARAETLIRTETAPPSAAAAEKESAPLVDPVQEAVQTIAALHARAERRVDPHQRMIERVSTTIGRPASLYIVLIFVAFWIGLNIALPASGRPAWDVAPFYWLDGLVGLAALLTTLVVVITQRRQDVADERRAQLDLQISLVIEQKTTKLIALVEELRRDLPNVQNRADPEAERMTESADPQVMLIALEHMLNEAVEEIGDMQGEAIEKQKPSPAGEQEAARGTTKPSV